MSFSASSCPRCAATNGRAHSFERLGVLSDSRTQLYYSCPAMQEEDDNTPEAIQYYVAHFESTRPHPWVWVFNCKGMRAADLIRSGLARKMAETAQQPHFDTLREVYIVNPTTTMRALLAFLSPFLKKEMRARIKVCTLGPIDTIHTLERIGVQPSELTAITRKLTA